MVPNSRNQVFTIESTSLLALAGGRRRRRGRQRGGGTAEGGGVTSGGGKRRCDGRMEGSDGQRREEEA
jgi:hypothetical protein